MPELDQAVGLAAVEALSVVRRFEPIDLLARVAGSPVLALQDYVGAARLIKEPAGRLAVDRPAIRDVGAQARVELLEEEWSQALGHGSNPRLPYLLLRYLGQPKDALVVDVDLDLGSHLASRQLLEVLQHLLVLREREHAPDVALVQDVRPVDVSPLEGLLLPLPLAVEAQPVLEVRADRPR